MVGSTDEEDGFTVNSTTISSNSTSKKIIEVNGTDSSSENSDNTTLSGFNTSTNNDIGQVTLGSTQNYLSSENGSDSENIMSTGIAEAVGESNKESVFPNSPKNGGDDNSASIASEASDVPVGIVNILHGGENSTSNLNHSAENNGEASTSPSGGSGSDLCIQTCSNEVDNSVTVPTSECDSNYTCSEASSKEENSGTDPDYLKNKAEENCLNSTYVDDHNDGVPPIAPEEDGFSSLPKNCHNDDDISNPSNPANLTEDVCAEKCEQSASNGSGSAKGVQFTSVPESDESIGTGKQFESSEIVLTETAEGRQSEEGLDANMEDTSLIVPLVCREKLPDLEFNQEPISNLEVSLANDELASTSAELMETDGNETCELMEAENILPLILGSPEFNDALKENTYHGTNFSGRSISTIRKTGETDVQEYELHVIPLLELECEDEPVAQSQSRRIADEEIAFREAQQLVRRWTLKDRLEMRRKGMRVIGHRPQASPSVRTIMPSVHSMTTQRLVTPPLRAPQAAMPLTTSIPPISIVRQKTARPRGQIVVRPHIPTNLSNITATSVSQLMGLTTPQPASSLSPWRGYTAMRPITVGEAKNAAAMSAGLNGENSVRASSNEFQSLLLDTGSGLILLPNNVTPDQVQTNRANVCQIKSSIARSIMTNTPIQTVANIISSNRLPASLRPTASTLLKSVTAASAQAAQNTFLPRIVSTSSLSCPNANKSTTRPAPPLLRPAILPRTSATLAAKLPTATRAIPRPQLQRNPNFNLHSASFRRIPPTPVQLPAPLVPRIIAAPKQPATSAVSRPNLAPPETQNTQNGVQPREPDSGSSKTFPSLVVIVKPCLGEKVNRTVMNNARIELDGRVKQILLHTPSKLTEWLMQQGLLRLEHRCPTHMTPDGENIKYKLGMYSESTKQPFSGGYIWISECCAEKQISVFHGSIFESTVYTPSLIIKLIYHWACQTSAQNVLLWVKVSSYYLKNFYTLLRSCCVAALHEYAPIMGGPHKFVEVGIITLGTAPSQAPLSQKAVKIEILGVYDPVTKVIRMKVINPLGSPSTSTPQSRIQQILWPLRHWVDKESTLLIDNSVEKTYLQEMGFKSVLQSKMGEISIAAGQHTNYHVMNYLKYIIPKMFQSTLCVLSKSLIQQFLDELSWRELWGTTSAKAFDNIIQHLVQMTKWEMGESLIARLNKISLNPFAEWSYTRHTQTGIDMLPDSIRSVGSDVPTLESYVAYAEANGYLRTTPPSSQGRKRKEPSTTEQSKSPIPIPEEPPKKSRRISDSAQRAKLRSYLYQADVNQSQMINLFVYYYGEFSVESVKGIYPRFPTNLECPECSRVFTSNNEIIRHVARHVYPHGKVTGGSVFCELCLHKAPNLKSYYAHQEERHRFAKQAFPCYICEEVFSKRTSLIFHMWETHGKCETPYKCDVCGYKNSIREEMVMHFFLAHSGTDQVLCPICLKVLPARNTLDLKSIASHIQLHYDKKGKQCSQCVLNFHNDMDLRSHYAAGLHDCSVGQNYSNPKSILDKEVLMPLPPKETEGPKAKHAPVEKTYHLQMPKHSDERYELYSFQGSKTPRIYSTKFFLPDSEDPGETYTCAECEVNVQSSSHFAGNFMMCSKCRFSTSCEMSMLAHNRNRHLVYQKRKAVPSIAVKSSKVLRSRLECDCGHSETNGQKMLTHMTECESNSGILTPLTKEQPKIFSREVESLPLPEPIPPPSPQKVDSPKMTDEDVRNNDAVEVDSEDGVKDDDDKISSCDDMPQLEPEEEIGLSLSLRRSSRKTRRSN